MTVQNVRLKVTSPALKLKAAIRLDATVKGTGFITVTQRGTTFTVSPNITLAPSATIDTTNAANITSGTLPAARLGSGKKVFGFFTGQSFLTQTPALAYTPAPNLFVWNWDGTDGHVGTAFVAPSATTINMSVKMMSDMAYANPTSTFYLYNKSFTGLAISHWLAGAGAPDVLANIQLDISAALTAAGCTQADFGVWAQGPANTLPITQTYVADHATWMNRLWADATPGHVWFPKETPLIVCSMQSVADSNSLNADADNMNVVLNAVANADPDKRRYVYLSSLSGSTYWDLTAHPTAQGHLSMGALLAAEFLNGSGRSNLQGITVNPANGNVCVGNPAYSAVPFIINLNTSYAPTAPVSGARRHVVGPDAGNVFDAIDTYGSGTFSQLIGFHARGTQAVPTKLLSGDLIHGMGAQGRDGVADVRVNKASMLFVAREDWNDATHHGTGLDVYLTQLATNTTALGFSIDPGFITVYGTTSGSCTFGASATGAAQINGVLVGALATVVAGTGIATALAINTGSAGAPVLFNGAGGTPSSMAVTNLTGTASININGTVGATTPGTGAFTTLAYSTTLTGTSASANALAVGANGTTNPVLNVDDSTASVATGWNVKGAAAAGGAALSVISSGTNEKGTIDAKGSGNLLLQTVATGNVGIQATILSSALTIGGTGNSNTDTGFEIAVSGNITAQSFNRHTSAYTVLNFDAAAITFRIAGSSSNGLYLSTTGGVSVGVNSDPGQGGILANGLLKSQSATAGIGYATGAGGAVTQLTSRTTGVTLNKVSGAITLFAAAPAVGTWVSCAVTNSAVAATDTIIVSVKSGTNTYIAHVTAVAAGSFQLSFTSIVGTASDSPVINFNVIKGVAS